MKSIAVTGAFDDLHCRHVRFLEKAAALGELTVLLWPDAAVEQITGRRPKFPEAERGYVLSAIRHVQTVEVLDGPVDPDRLPEVSNFWPEAWAVDAAQATAAQAAHAQARGLTFHVLGESTPSRPLPPWAPSLSGPGRKKVVVTGCYDWLHSGHVRFFEEASAYGDLYVVIGHDANIRLLKGEGHPLFPQEDRRYLAGSIRFVTQALISSGLGWLDAEPEILQIRPDVYIVNEDGDRGGKREFCAQHGIEYRVLRRIPAPGLPPRSSTTLRGF